jgi:hypothetical protein
VADNLPTRRTLPTRRDPATAVEQYLAKLTPAAQVKAAEQRAARGRLIFALDATASRDPTWDHACRLQGDMFGATAGIGGLDVQLVFYRGYGECKASRWFTTAGELHQAMRQVRCEAGETQIERVLTHAIGETGKHKVAAMIFVGDCMEEKLDRLCHLAGDLGRLGVPLFMFHEGLDPIAASGFRQMASLSHGAYLAFDLAGIARLRELLAAVAVYASGGYPALAAYGDKKGGGEVLRLASQLRG